MLIRRVVAIFGAFLALSAVLVSAPVAPAVAQTGDGDWVGTVGADGYALVGMNNGADVAQFPVARFVGPSSRLFWEDPSTDVRALESPDQSHRVAARWYSSGTVSMSLIFHEAYAGPLNLYGVDFDDTGRVQNVKVTHGSTVLGEEEWSNFSAGYWMETSIDVPAGAVVQIQATRLQGNESVISGVFLGSGTPSQNWSGVQGDWIDSYGSDGYALIGATSAEDIMVIEPARLAWYQPNRVSKSQYPGDSRALVSPHDGTLQLGAMDSSAWAIGHMDFTEAYSGTISVYAVDWETQRTEQTIKVTTAAQGTQTEFMTGFQNGAWVTFDIDAAAGERVVVRADRLVGRAQVSGVFLGNGGPPHVPSYTSVQGDWRLLAGGAGAWFPGEATNGSYANINPFNAATETFQEVTWDPRGPVVGVNRTAKAWKGTSYFDINVTFNVAYTGSLWVYGVDWDSHERSQEIWLVEGGQITQKALWNSMRLGAWAEFPIDANAGETIRVQARRLKGSSALLSGLFLGPRTASPEDFTGPDVDSQGYGGDPVNVATGSFTDSWTDIAYGAADPLLGFARSYNSVDPAISPLGQGWAVTYDDRIHETNGEVLLTTSTGRLVVFADDGAGGWDSSGEFSGTLIDDGDGTYSVEYVDGTIYDFDGSGWLSSVANWAGDSVTIDRDSGTGLATTATSSTGRSLSFDYDTNRRLTTLTASDGQAMSFTYDPNGYLIDIDHTGNSWEFDVDSEGLISEIRDGEDRVVVTNTYDPTTYRVTEQTTPHGGTVTFSYDDVARVTTLTDNASGDVTTYSYDTDNRLVGMTDPDSETTTRSFDANGYPTGATDREGNTTSSVVNPLGQLEQYTNADGTATIDYDSGGRVTRTVDTDGLETLFSYTGTNRIPDTITTPAGVVTITQSNGRINAVTDPTGATRSYSYDAAGNLTSETDPTGLVTAYTYDTAGRVLTVTTPDGAVTTNTYNSTGQLQTRDHPASGTTTYTYNTAGQIASVADDSGATTTYTYNTAGQVATVTDPAGATTTYAYSGAGDLTTVTDHNNNTTTYTYGPLGRLTAITDPSGGQQSYTYNANGQIASATDANGQTTSYTYDAMGRKASETTPTGATLSYTYDTAGRMLTTTDAAGAVTSYTYDTAGRVATITDPTGNTTTNTYDSASRLTGKAFSGGTSVSYTYDNSGRRLTMVDSTGTTTYTYDTAGRLDTVTDPTGAQIGYDWANGQLSAITYPDGSTASYTYTSRGQIDTLTHPDLGSTIDYTYNPAAQLTNTALPGSQSRGFTYNTSGQLTGYAQTVDAGLNDVTLTHNPNNDLASVTTAGLVTVDYTYDPARQLTGDTTSTYTYDKGRRTGVTEAGINGTYSYDNASQVTSYTDNNPGGSTSTPTYDAAGRLTSIDDTTITYNARGLIDTITTTSLTGATTQTRGYNGDNQLVDITSTRPDNSTETHHLIWTHIPGIPQVLAHTVDGQTNNYLYGNTREAVNRPDGTTDLFAYDHLGSTVTTIPTADLAIDTGYTNYGAPTTGIDPTKIGFGYRGELHTGPTIHLRNRDYQPQHGIFTTTDPLPAVTGTPVAANPYHYTNNNPLNLTDPLGLRPSDGGFWDFLPDCITGPGCESLVSQWTGGEVCSRMYGATDVRCDSTVLNRNMGYVATGFGTVSLGCSVGVVMPCSASTYAFELLSSESARYANCDRPLAVDHEQCSRAERSLAIGIIGVPVPGPFVINDFAAYLFGLQAAYGSDAAYKTSDCHPISFGPFLGSYPGPNECGQ